MFNRHSRARQALPAPRSRRPTLEDLEGRRLLSLDAPFGSPVNTTRPDDQFDAHNATNARGRTVVVWADTSDSTDHDIRAQRYNSAGGKIGTEIVVSLSGLDETKPRVAVDDVGNFVIAWTKIFDDGNSDVVARRYDANGIEQGGIIQVANSSDPEYDPDIATNLTGDFAVSYTKDFDSDDQDIFYKRFDSDGDLISDDNPAGSGDSETHSRIAMSRTGQVDIVWEREVAPDDHDIFLARYNRDGVSLGQRAIAESGAFDRTPAISMDDSSNAVVAWEQDGDIKAIRVSASGRSGATVTIAATSGDEFNPSVALRRGGGGFVVTYQRDTRTSTRAMVAEVTPSNRVTTITAGTYEGQTVSINASGIYFTTYTAKTGRDLNIRARRGRLRA